MDDTLKRSASTVLEFRTKLVVLKKELIDELDRVTAILDTIDEGKTGTRSVVDSKYDVIDDISTLIRDAEKPMPQSEIFAKLKQTVMEKLRYTEKEAQSNIYRSLWYHTKHGPGAQDDRGIRAVEFHGGKYRVTPFKTKGARTQYPDNLIWHVDKIKAAS